MGRAERITRELKNHDSQLYCDWGGAGRLCVYRKSTRWESYYLDEDAVLSVARPTPYFIFALTENWSLKAEPKDWGVEPIMARIKAIDLWNRDLAEEIIQNTEKETESLARDRKNTTESFLLDFRKQFAKTFDDVNTANLSKKDKRRLHDKSVYRK